MFKFSSLFLALLIIFVIGYALKQKVDVFENFIIGVEDALKVVKKIFPALAALFVAVGFLRSSGVIDLLGYLIEPITKIFNIPSEIVPLIILRPISGSASLAVVVDIFKDFGVDTTIGRIVSVLMGSTETIFYVVALYFGVIGIKNVRYALIAAISAEVFGIILCCNIIK